MSCSEWYTSGHTQSGEYIIDPDKDGCLQPFTVQCDMSHVNPVTMVTHNIQGYHLVNNSTPLDEVVEYGNASYDDVRGLIKHSAKCWYHYNHSCIASAFSGHDYWISYSGMKMVDWLNTSEWLCPGKKLIRKIIEGWMVLWEGAKQNCTMLGEGMKWLVEEASMHSQSWPVLLITQ